MYEKPKLRQVQAIPFQSEGEQLVCLRDPTGLSTKSVVLPVRAFFIAALLDGQRTLLDVQAEYARQFGDLLLSESVQKLVQQLDEALLLEGARFETHRRAAIEEFARATTRPSALAGTAFPRQPQSVRAMLDSFFEAKDGPGRVDPSRRGESVVAVAAPHIDLRRGGACYAYAWKALAEGCSAETFVILGVAHCPTRALFVISDKDFETPLGVAACDRSLASDLMRRAGLRKDEDEFVHRSEHSIEFQALWLRGIFGATRPARIVPVLCGPILDRVGTKPNPLDVGEVADFVGALKEILQEQRGRVAVIASVDLSHVGRRFGDDTDLTPGLLGWIEAEDRALLKHAEDMDAPAFFERNRRDGDRRHICGFSALYTLLASVPARRGRLLHYAQSPESETQSVVTFAAMVFEK